MKKILLTLAFVFGMGIKTSALSTTAILLQHNGNITTYAAEDIATVMEDATDGDEVFLNEGTYPGFTITKKLKISGVGEKSIISGDISIEIPDEPSLKENLFQFLKVNGNVVVNSALRNLLINQCYIEGMFQVKARLYDSYINRCSLYYLTITGTYDEWITIDEVTKVITHPYVNNLTVTNSVITSIAEGLGYSKNMSLNASFVNCYINLADGVLGNIVNSIVNKIWYSNPYKLYHTVFVNSYLNTTESERNVMPVAWDEETCTLTGCYLGKGYLKYDSEDIATNGYLGNDGTIIGPLGGNTPFTLVPTVPHVTEASLKVDPKKQELNATLTVSPN